MIRVASYCRVSTDKSDQANSFASQQRFFREYIQNHPDWELHAVYADEGITGTSTQKRVQFNRMIADAAAGKFQLILTKEISRFSRNILDTIRYTRELKAMGVGVLFLTENLNTLHPESEMLLTFMGTIAQEESRRTSVRVKWGQTRRMEQGVVFGRSLLGYDVKDGKITVDPEGAALVRRIFHKYGVEKKGTSVIARELEREGYRTYSGKETWDTGCIIKILKNEKYVGDLVQKKSITPDYLTHAKKANRGEEQIVVLREHHTPIVDRGLWDAVQRELKRRNKRSASPVSRSCRHAFSGKILCGECGSQFVARYQTVKNGPKRLRWSCAGASRGCQVAKLLRDDDARHMLKTALESLPLDPAAIASEVTGGIRRAGECCPDETPRLQKELAKLEKKNRNLVDAFVGGDISREDYQRLSAEYSGRIDALKQRIAEAVDPGSVEETESAVGAILAFDRESDVFIKSILESITVFKDRHMELKLQFLSQTFHFLG